MRDEVRAAMGRIEDMDTEEIVGELRKHNPFGGYSVRDGRLRLAATLLNYEHAPLQGDEGWDA